MASGRSDSSARYTATQCAVSETWVMGVVMEERCVVRYSPAMTQATLPVKRSFGATRRPDTWWIQPGIVFLLLGGFVVYATWAAFQGDHYRFGPYLSPFYSPELFGSADSWFGAWPAWWPGLLRLSPALLI